MQSIQNFLMQMRTECAGEPLGAGAVATVKGPTEPERSRGQEETFFWVPRNATIIFAVWLVSVLACMATSHFGRYAIATMSGDWAGHMLLAETYFHNVKLPDNSPLKWADEGLEGGLAANYPHLSSSAVAVIAYYFDLNPLRSIQAWSLVLLLTGCLFTAIRVVYVRKHMLSSGTLLLTAAWLAACSYCGFGLRGHVQENFFFAQFFGTVLAICGLAILQRHRPIGPLTLLGVILWGGIVLPNSHLVPAIWFILAAVLQIFLVEERVRRALVECGIVIVACGVLATGPASTAMLQAANHNGWLLIRFCQLSEHPVCLAAGLGLVLLVIAAALGRLLQTHRGQALRAALVPYCGLIAVSGLIILQGTLLLALHRGSIYAVAKYIYIVALEMAMLVSSIELPLREAADRFLQPHRSWAKAVCVVILFLAQAPFIGTPYDQELLMQVRERMMQLGIRYNPEHRVYPQFPALDYPRNFYLAIGVMRIPRDSRTWRWLRGGGQGEESFAWPMNNPYGLPPLGEEAAMVVASNFDYSYTVRVTDGEGKALSTAAPVKLPVVLKIDMDVPHANQFKLAPQIPATKGFVSLGYLLLDKSFKQITEGRSVITGVGTKWHSEIVFQKLPPEVAAIEFSPVHELITWFFSKQPPDMQRIVLAEPRQLSR